MRHDQTLGLRHHLARCGQELDAALPAVLAQSQAAQSQGAVLVSDERSQSIGRWFTGAGWRGGLVLPSLPLEGQRQ